MNECVAERVRLRVGATTSPQKIRCSPILSSASASAVACSTGSPSTRPAAGITAAAVSNSLRFSIKSRPYLCKSLAYMSYFQQALVSVGANGRKVT
jgi:hypothetical protein